MRGDDKLSQPTSLVFPNDAQERELTGRRQGCFRLVQQVQRFATTAKSIGEESQERFAVGLLVQRLSAVGCVPIFWVVSFHFVDMRGEVEKTLPTKNVTARRKEMFDKP